MTRVDKTRNLSQIEQNISGLYLLEHTWLFIQQRSAIAILCIGANWHNPTKDKLRTWHTGAPWTRHPMWVSAWISSMHSDACAKPYWRRVPTRYPIFARGRPSARAIAQDPSSMQCFFLKLNIASHSISLQAHVCMFIQSYAFISTNMQACKIIFFIYCMCKKHDRERAHHIYRLGPTNLMYDKEARPMLHGAIQRVWLAIFFFAYELAINMKY